MGCASPKPVAPSEGTWAAPADKGPVVVIAKVVPSEDGPSEDVHKPAEDLEVHDVVSVTSQKSEVANAASNNVVTMTVTPSWIKPGSSLTWKDSEAHAQKMGGRLLGLDEARAFLEKNGPIYPGEDQWAAVMRAGGLRDWVQVGNKIHHVGKSHVDEQGGYPKWGDDASGNPPYSRSVLWVSGKEGGSQAAAQPQWAKPGGSMTWKDSEAHAQKMGGRLLELVEARGFLEKYGPIYPGEDQWAAVTHADGVRDWVQVGNKIHHVGKSHVYECGGYPKWGDDASGSPPHSHSVLWILSQEGGSQAVPGPQWAKPGVILTWKDSEAHVRKKGGRLLGLREAQDFLDKNGAIYPGEDQWAAVTRPDGSLGGRDWVQVGNKIHYVGKSHVDDQGNYPRWGDDTSKNPPYRSSILWIRADDSDASASVPEWSKQGTSFTWRAAKSWSESKGGRLLDTEEPRAFLQGHGAIYPGEDQWVAVTREGVERDWVQVGNSIHKVGKSHVDECGGYPAWGDDASGNPPHSRAVVWTTRPASLDCNEA